MERIKIKYFTDKIDKLCCVAGKSDWIDLRAAEDAIMKKGEFKLISLGVAMELPEGYEAHIVPRSSTFKNFGVIQANSVGIIDMLILSCTSKTTTVFTFQKSNLIKNNSRLVFNYTELANPVINMYLCIPDSKNWKTPDIVIPTV